MSERQFCERHEVWITWENVQEHDYCSFAGLVSQWADSQGEGESE